MGVVTFLMAWVLANIFLTMFLVGIMDVEICGWDDLLWILVMALVSPVVVIAAWRIEELIRNRRK
jgi:hypothetical protein